MCLRQFGESQGRSSWQLCVCLLSLAGWKHPADSWNLYDSKSLQKHMYGVIVHLLPQRLSQKLSFFVDKYLFTSVFICLFIYLVCFEDHFPLRPCGAGSARGCYQHASADERRCAWHPGRCRAATRVVSKELYKPFLPFWVPWRKTTW